MQVHINEVVSRVRAVDGESLLTRDVLQRIVAAVVDALDEKRASESARKRDTQIEAPDGTGEP